MRMIEAREKPLVTFFVFSYNQERFIRQAVEAAFAQTYSPLEIILSDDCSPDGTFDVICSMAASYHGPHKVIVNRNAKNLGIGSHINKIVELSRGELLVTSAGDDISLPERTSKLVQGWQAKQGKVFSVYSNSTIIDDSGNVIRPYHKAPARHSSSVTEVARRHAVGVQGCAHAFSRKCFESFGPLPKGVIAEDEAISFRSLLLGEIVYLAEELVRYRFHPANISVGDGLKGALAEYRKARRRQLDGWIAVVDSWMVDLHKAALSGLIPDDADALCLKLAKYKEMLQREAEFAERDFLSGLFQGLTGAFRGKSPITSARCFARAWIAPEMRAHILSYVRGQAH